MGGSAFTTGRSHPLLTPRMPKDVYDTVKARCHAVLREHYLCVASPIDGPGKKDFGDVDILLAWPLRPSASKHEAFNTIAEVLKATDTIMDKGKELSGHLALPWPRELYPAPDSVQPGALDVNSYCDPHLTPDNLDDALHARHHPPSGESASQSRSDDTLTTPGNQTFTADQHLENKDEELFIQVDVRVCDSLEYFQWMLFKHAHGDMWNLLGTTIRPYGLSVDERSLWLRIPEIEAFNRNRAKVFLTSDPVEILQFLGLPIENFWTDTFEDLDAMYEYVARCRLFWVKPLDPETDGAATGLEQDRKKLKANDRKRMNQRPGFRKWVEEFKPRCRAEGRFLIQPTNREQVTQEAFDWFHIQREFEARRLEFLLERNKEMIWTNVIKGSIPDANASNQREMMYRSCLVKALKRVILEGDARYGVLPEGSLMDEDGFYVTEDVVKFITLHQDTIGRVAMDINQAGFEKHKKKKAAKESGQRLEL
ncbi:hypothetical protein B0J13DRAFT_104988 [Dactylonectria estremocensis]|uniref:Uncharacterized protein n=1 Tax=Dactylonectria estremocensis TaxID=1079267 RepID=A0A9P9E5U5_9HYPO|nr:hypothetical protein B0J13DRAFT_104988 [Dactylonectria estremocensis]